LWQYRPVKKHSRLLLEKVAQIALRMQNCISIFSKSLADMSESFCSAVSRLSGGRFDCYEGAYPLSDG